MYMMYVDESGDPGPKGSRFLLLGGAALFEGKWKDLDRDLSQLPAHLFPHRPRPSEIHMTDLLNGKNHFRAWLPAERQQLADEFCRLVTNLLPTELVLFSVVVDKPWWFQQNPGKTGDDLYAELFENLSSRFDLFLRRRYAEGYPSKGIIIADEHKESLSKALRLNQRQFQTTGHRWGTFKNLIETIFFLPSDDSPGLQLADLASYAVWRAVSASDSSIAVKLANMFDREPLNSRIDPGKWHGIKYLGVDPSIHQRLSSIWT